MAHFGVGGGWARYPDQPKAPGPPPLWDAGPRCASFYGMVGQRGEDKDLGSYVYPENNGCFECPDCKGEGLAPEDCVCACARRDCGCAGVWTGEPEYVEYAVHPRYVQMVGDMCRAARTETGSTSVATKRQPRCATPSSG